MFQTLKSELSSHHAKFAGRCQSSGCRLMGCTTLNMNETHFHFMGLCAVCTEAATGFHKKSNLPLNRRNVKQTISDIFS